MSVTSLFTCLAILISTPGASLAQSTALETFQGRWQLIDYQEQDETGEWQWMHIGLQGYLLYDGIGGMGVHQVPLDYDAYTMQGKGGRSALTTEDQKHLAGNFVYFGKYRVDTTDHTIAHLIDAHSNPERWGTVAKRHYTFSGDTLFLQPVDRDPPLRIVWHRLNDTPSIADHFNFASPTMALKLLQQEDDFTRSWSQFDIDSRLHHTNGTRKQLFDYIGEQVLEWSAEETALIDAAVRSIDKDIEERDISLSIPDSIFIIKSTCNEEGGAVAYTRSNYIVLQEGLDLSDEWNLKRLILHELFHILSRQDQTFRDSLYAIIGFRPMNSVAYPASIADLRITNPDAPQTDSYIELVHKEIPVSCMMVLYSDTTYSGEGDFFDYLNIGFLALEGDDKKSPKFENGEPVIYAIGEVGWFFEKIGNNTSYIIHPEEIMADNFSYAVTGKEGLPDPHIVGKVLTYLQK